MDVYKGQPMQGNSWTTSGAGSSTGLGYVGNAIEPTSSPVRDRIGAAEQWLSELHKSVDVLEQRLDTILTPIPPAGIGQGVATPTQAIRSHVQGRLEILNDGFSHLNGRLNQLLNRVEL